MSERWLWYLLVSLFTRGRKVTSLGVLFDFTGNDKNTTVQKVEDMVKEAWFAEAIKEDIVAMKEDEEWVSTPW